jgi:hypothetical protein
MSRKKFVDIEQWKREHRMKPELLGELLSVHASCVHAQENKCPLLVSLKSFCWELNQAMDMASEEDRGFRRTNADGLLAARPLNPRTFSREEEE